MLMYGWNATRPDLKLIEKRFTVQQTPSELEMFWYTRQDYCICITVSLILKEAQYNCCIGSKVESGVRRGGEMHGRLPTVNTPLLSWRSKTSALCLRWSY